MELNLKGKVVFISGSGRGIGLAIAKCFAEEGAHVILNDINKVTLDNAVQEISSYPIEVIGLCGNVSVESECQAMFNEIKDKFGYLDILVNNAAVLMDKPIIEMNMEEWNRIILNNIGGVFVGTKEAVKIMDPTRKPVIINGASFASTIPAMGYGCYAASKAAIVSLTKSLCGELSGMGIRVVGYNPGLTNTDINKELFAREPERLCAQIPLNRIAEPEEVAKIVCFLASDVAGYIAGSMVDIYGGKLCVQNANRYRNQSN